jgi:hypothetical protein
VGGEIAASPLMLRSTSSPRISRLRVRLIVEKIAESTNPKSLWR